jgi:diacylglycerol kinase (CTP)
VWLNSFTPASISLSWADTAASTIGRLYGSYTPKLPARLPFLRLPLAPRKSLAGFIAATITGSAIAFGFWAYIAPLRASGTEMTWSWDDGVRQLSDDGEVTNLGAGGVFGLIAISVVSGLVSGIAEALGELFSISFFFPLSRCIDLDAAELGSLDDNLTLPIISGGCILGFLKLIGAASSWLSS